MTHDDALRLQPTRPCDGCHCVGIEFRVEPNNGGTYVHCSACGRKHAWTGVQYLKMDRTKKRPPAPAHLSLESVWSEYGDRCVVCDRTRAEIAILVVGRAVHHTPRYLVAEHQGKGLPVCSECHELLNWRQRLVDRERRSLAGGA